MALRTHGAPFRMLVAPGHSGDPAAGRPFVPIRQVHTFQSLDEGGGRRVNGVLAGAAARATGSLLVADADFSTGRAAVVVGPYELIGGIDFAVVDNGGALATGAIAINLAAAINRLTSVSAQAVGSTVNIQADDRFAFFVVHLGGIANFTTVVPADGQLTEVSPKASAPVITLPVVHAVFPAACAKNAALVIQVTGVNLTRTLHVDLDGFSNVTVTVAGDGLSASVSGTMENVAGTKTGIVRDQPGQRGTILRTFTIEAT